MKVVDERAPGRILAEAGVGKTYDRAVALGDNSAGPWVRDGQAFGPQRSRYPATSGYWVTSSSPMEPSPMVIRTATVLAALSESWPNAASVSTGLR